MANAVYAVLLTFAENRDESEKHKIGHRDWLTRGFDDGVFLLAGRLQPDRGGFLLCHSTNRADLDARLAADPFVAGKVVSAEILEVSPARADPRLGFLAA